MDPGTLSIVWFTLQVAAAATLLILVPGVLLAWALSRPGWPGRNLVETVVNVPLVVPPTAVGLGLLLALGRSSPFGAWLADAGLEVVFTWRAVVLACAVVSFPLLVRQARSALEEVDPALLGVARTLGHGRWSTFLRVQAPLAWRGVLAGVVLAFTRALGEFGATILVAGNIPGRTQTLALALFQRIQAGREGDALRLALISVALAFVTLSWAEYLSRARQRSLEE